jgi:Domain of unknown function (DUF222)/HNH endonuclease
VHWKPPLVRDGRFEEQAKGSRARECCRSSDRSGPAGGVFRGSPSGRGHARPYLQLAAFQDSTCGVAHGFPQISVRLAEMSVQCLIFEGMFETAMATAPVQAVDSECPLERLETEICDLAAHLAAATCRWLLLVAEFDRRRGWAGWGLLSCAHWLSWKCGISLKTAREQVRVARALEELPRTRAAFGAGRISYSKTRAITRVAATDTEADWVDLATHAPAAHLDRLVSGYIKVGAADAADRRAKTRVSWHWEPDGTLRIHARLGPEEGAVVLAALRAASERGESDPERTLERSSQSRQDASPTETSAEDPPPTPVSPNSITSDTSTTDPTSGARPAAPFDASAEGFNPGTDRPSYADALVAMAEAFLQYGHSTASGADLHTVLVHISADMLGSHGSTTDAASRSAPPLPADDAESFSVEEHRSRLAVHGRLHLDDGPALDPGTLRCILCDTSTIVMLHDTKGGILNLGRKTRRINNALRRALKERDGGCRFPGCGNRRADAHHLRHWIHGGETKLENLILLCRRHHRMLHDEQFVIASPQPGKFIFLRPDGQQIPLAPTPPRPHGTLEERHASTGVAPIGLAPDWYGDRLDLHYAVSVLAIEHERRRGYRHPVTCVPGQTPVEDHPQISKPQADIPARWN